MNNFKAKCIEFWRWLTNLSWWRFVLFQYLLTFVPLFVSIVLMNILVKYNEGFPEYEPSVFFFLSMIPTVFLETVIFQHLVFKLFESRWKTDDNNKPSVYIIVSSIAFGLVHLLSCKGVLWFDIVKICDALAGGIILAVSYYILWCKKQHPIIGVFLIHLLYNFTLLLLYYLFNQCF